MVSSPKKSATKKPAAQRGAVKKAVATGPAKGQHATHPSWADMIKECIISHPEEARMGVSRPTIKKFVETKYKLEMNPSATSQLSRAIAHGAEKGTFVLPKGPTGRVKLPPKGHKEATKENTPVPKKTPAPAKAAVKPKPAPKKAAPVDTDKKSSAPKAKAVKKPNVTSKTATKKSMTAASKAGSAPKKLLARMGDGDSSPPKKRRSSMAKNPATGENAAPSKATKPRSKATSTKEKEGKPASTPSQTDKPEKTKSARRTSVSKKAAAIAAGAE